MNPNLHTLREEINGIDLEILKLLKRRFEIAGEIKEIKEIEKLEIEDGERERELFGIYESVAGELNLDVEFVKKIFEDIILESKKIQSNK